MLFTLFNYWRQYILLKPFNCVLVYNIDYLSLFIVHQRFVTSCILSTDMDNHVKYWIQGARADPVFFLTTYYYICVHHGYDKLRQYHFFWSQDVSVLNKAWSMFQNGKWPLLINREIDSKRPKRPNIVPLWLVDPKNTWQRRWVLALRHAEEKSKMPRPIRCHGGHLCRQICHKNTNMVEECE